MGSKTTTVEKSDQHQTVAPPSWTMPGIQETSNRVLAALDQLKNQPKYDGNFIAQPNYTGALDAYGAAANKATDLSNWTQGQMQGYTPVTANFSRDFSGLDTSAGLPGAINAAIAPVQKQLLEQTLPGLRNSALESGAYSNDRAIATMPEMAIRDSNESQQRIAAQLGYQDLQDNANRNLQAYGLDTERGLGVANLGADQQAKYMAALPDLIDTIMRTSTSAGDIRSQMATMGQTQEQAGIDNARARNDYNWQYPFQGLDIASSLLAQLSGNYGTTDTLGNKTTTQSTGGLGAVMQGVLGAASLAGSFLAPGAGAAAGSAGHVASPLASMFASTTHR